MTREETKQILMRIQASYTNWKPEAGISFTTDLWHEYFRDYPYKTVLAAVVAFVTSDASGFPPSVGQIINMIHTVAKPNGISEQEAWDLVSRAIRNGTYGAEEEFAKLPEIVQKCVTSPSQLRAWACSDLESIETVVRSNFRRTFNTVREREESIARMPKEIQHLISTVNTAAIQEKQVALIESSERDLYVGSAKENDIDRAENGRKKTRANYREELERMWVNG